MINVHVCPVIKRPYVVSLIYLSSSVKVGSSLLVYGKIVQVIVSQVGNSLNLQNPFYYVNQ